MNPDQQSGIIGIFIVGAVFLFVMGIVAWFIWKIWEQKRREAEAAQAFEREFDQEFVGPNVGTIQGTPSLAATPQSAAQTPKQDFYPPKEATPEPSPMFATLAQKPPLEPSTVVSPSDRLIARLKEAGLFESSDGPYLPLDPSGSCILIRLKRKKTALIVPRFESEYFLSQALKRFDYVFLVLSNQDVLVLNKFSSFIAGHFDLR